MRPRLFAVIAVLALAGCSSTYPPADQSVEQRISRDLNRAADQRSASNTASAGAALSAQAFNELVQPSLDSAVPASARQSASPRFDLVVTEAPLGEVLAGVVAGTQYSLLIRPSAGAPAPDPLISLNLKNVTLFEALDSIRAVTDMEYTVAGNRIIVEPSSLQTRLYRVDYIVGQRRGVSDLQVIGGASVGTAGTTTSGVSGTTTSGSSYASVQASGLTTSVRADFWGEAEDALRTILGCAIPKATAGAATRSAVSQSGVVSRADVSFPGESQVGERLRGSEGCPEGRRLTVNQMSGTLLVRAMPNELRMVDQLLASMQVAVTRQVIIEAKIIDVALNKDAQQGINWAAFRNGNARFSVGASPGAVTVNPGASGGGVSATTTLGDLLGTTLVGVQQANAFSQGLGVAVQARNFAALINFLESQGKVFVLSSPRIAAINNQKAVIKVGTEEPFVTNISGGSQTAGAGSQPITVNPSLVYQPFFSGISLDVTPQVDAEDNITLHVHSMVNTVSEVEKTGLLTGDATRVPFARNSINETDSVVRARDGQVIVIGGLMKEETSDGRAGIPGVRDVPGVGALFNKGQQESVKRELVILLRATIVKDDQAWAQEIGAARDRIMNMGGASQPAATR